MSGTDPGLFGSPLRLVDEPETEDLARDILSAPVGRMPVHTVHNALSMGQSAARYDAPAHTPSPELEHATLPDATVLVAPTDSGAAPPLSAPPLHVPPAAITHAAPAPASLDMVPSQAGRRDRTTDPGTDYRAILRQSARRSPAWIVVLAAVLAGAVFATLAWSMWAAPAQRAPAARRVQRLSALPVPAAPDPVAPAFASAPAPLASPETPRAPAVPPGPMHPPVRHEPSRPLAPVASASAPAVAGSIQGPSGVFQVNE